MSTWNSGAVPATCHCRDCDAKPDPACVVCGEDEIELNEMGECAECAPREDETCEGWAARVATRRPK